MFKANLSVIRLPSFIRTVVCEEHDEGAVLRSMKARTNSNHSHYHAKPFASPHTGAKFRHNLLPIVLNKDGSPWRFACLYIMDLIEGDLNPDMETYRCIGIDLGLFKQWIDDNSKKDELLSCFPKFKLDRVTYRFASYLQLLFTNGQISKSVANRTIGNVVRIYRWLEFKKYLIPENSPWQEKHFNLRIYSQVGMAVNKKGTSTDLKVGVNSAPIAIDEYIIDDGMLRPLSEEEQRWIISSLKELDNIEMSLLLTFMLTTGARIQSACTLQIKHFLEPLPRLSKSLVGGEKIVKLKAGPGTGIDTKGDKNGVFMLPGRLYDALHEYAHSPRMIKRSKLTELGWQPSQYLFLTQQGSPYYESQFDLSQFKENFQRRHFKKGETVRQFLSERLIPNIRKIHDENFNFSVHDLRATYGMNMEQKLLILVGQGKVKMSMVRIILKELMWHTDAEVTDRYLNYRSKNNEVSEAINRLGQEIQSLVNAVKVGFK